MKRSAPSATAAPTAAMALVDVLPRAQPAPSKRGLPLGRRLAAASLVTALGAAVLAPSPAGVLAQNPCIPPPPGMVAWYPLDELAGATSVDDIAPAPDSLVNNSGMTMPGPLGPPSSGNGAVPVVGQVAGAHYFFSDKLHEVAPQAELDFGKGDFSIDAWIRDVGNGQKQAVVDKLDPTTGIGFALYFEGWFLHLNINGTTFTSVAQISHADPMANTGPWYHIAATVLRAGPSLDTAILYIDGAPSPWFVPPTGSVDNTLPMWIGNTRLPINPGEIAVDELEIFNRALTQVEVNDLYQAGPAGKCKSTPTHPTATHTPAMHPTATHTPAMHPTATHTPASHQTATFTPTSMVDITQTPTPVPTSITPIPIDYDLYLPITLVNDVLSSNATSVPTVPTAPRTAVPTTSPTPSQTPSPTSVASDTATATGSPPPWTATPSATATDEATPDLRTRTVDPTATSTPTVDLRTPSPTTTPAATPGCAPQPASMAAWWPLDELSGVVALDVIGGNTGAVQGGAAIANPAKVGPGRTFDGTSGLIVVASATTLDAGATDFSIDAWIRPETDALQPIVTKQYAPADAPLGYTFYLENRLLSFAMSNEDSALSGAATTILPVDGQWHFVAVTLERGSATGGGLYVDGALVGTFDATPLVGPVNTTAELHIAEQPALGRGLAESFFQGGIDEVEIFHRALSAAEILAIYDAGALGKCDKPHPQPMAAWGPGPMAPR